MTSRAGRALTLAALAGLLPARAAAEPPLYIAFHWHLHQPIYWPYESVVETSRRGAYGFDPVEVHRQRHGAYTAWPLDAVAAGMGAGLGSLGAQVSLSGSLMENLDALAAAGLHFAGWRDRWREAAGWRTEGGNPRVDLVAFGYHHPLLALIDGRDVGMQIRLHREKLASALGVPASRGIFPPETGFAPWTIPALVEAGIEWVLVDNIHFDRARADYPYVPESNLVPPNRADQRVTEPPVAWVGLRDLWAPSSVSAPWGYQPHHVVWTDPDTGAESRIVAVPAARYEGNEDARGGFGALQYERVLSQVEQHNTDVDHPMLVVLHHDGDNFGGGTESYYHGNFGRFVAWLREDPERFVCTTVQDYLDAFPPAGDDVVHVEAGSWSGADNGDPEFLKWNGDPDEEGYSPDRASWAVVTAAHNRVRTAEAIGGGVSSLQAVMDGVGSDVDRAWHFLLNAEASDYWYWDRSEEGIWDSHPTRACNEAVAAAEGALAFGVDDEVPPSLYLPQREPYNPGGIEWGNEVQPSDFDVWTFSYDVSGLARVVLHWREDPDGPDARVDADNLVRAGGVWREREMAARQVEVRTDPQPVYVADEYRARIEGLNDVLVDYWVEAVDAEDNIARSPLLHVWVGQQRAGGPAPAERGTRWAPRRLCPEDALTVWYPEPGHLHWGVDGWHAPPDAHWPEGTEAWLEEPQKAVDTPLVGPDEEGWYGVTVGPFDDPEHPVSMVDFVIRMPNPAPPPLYRWDNNDFRDWHVPVAVACGPGEGEGEGEGEGAEADAGPDAGEGFRREAGHVGPGSPEASHVSEDGCDCHVTGRSGDASGWLGRILTWTRRR